MRFKPHAILYYATPVVIEQIAEGDNAKPPLRGPWRHPKTDSDYWDTPLGGNSKREKFPPRSGVAKYPFPKHGGVLEPTRRAGRDKDSGPLHGAF